MDVEIVEKKENPLLNRTEVTFRLTHDGDKTPQRSAVRDQLAAETGAKRDAVIVTRMRSRYGLPITEGTAKVYKDAEAVKANERRYILARHNLLDEAKKEEKAEEAPPPPPPPKKEKAAEDEGKDAEEKED